MYADIIVDISAGQLDKTYQYRIPEELREEAVVGAPVVIPFGRTRKRGYIVGLSEEPKIEEERIKPIAGVESGRKAIESQLIELAWFIREHFGATMNAALHTVMPIKKEVRQVEKKTLQLIATDDVAADALATAVRKKYTAKVRLLTELINEKQLAWELVTGKLGISPATIRGLEENGILKIVAETSYRNPLKNLVRNGEAAEDYGNDKQQTGSDKNGLVNNSWRNKPVLNPEQEAVLNSFRSDWESGLRNTYLLYGVTGSGKTEVYLDMIEKVVADGKQVIMLIPEIALTYQTVIRFYHRFGDRISILNSRMSAGERYDQSMRAENGEIDVIIGPRSALFTPFPNLGLIIMDEEHESSYKSEMPPKYHAREVAVKRAQMAGASLVLGSATPSLEAYERALSGEYKLFELKNRAVAGAKLPKVTLVDLRKELEEGNRSIFSRALQEKITDRLNKREQIMLFLNRRGYAGFVSCRSCGTVIKCPHCDVSMTEHDNGKLICHYCGETTQKPTLCPTCRSKYIAGFGTGTQKIEELVKKSYPGARVLRMDADTTGKKESYEEILSAFSNGEADILIGTQMIVKGHDFPNVTLVGIIAADLSLNAEDFRAAERTFQLLSQASGRAGRGALEGDVIIQTYQPEHYAVEAAAAADYESFYEKETVFRATFGYPPIGHVLAVLVQGMKEEQASASAERMGNMAQQWISQESINAPEDTAKNISVIGPAPAKLSKAKDMYRYMIYFKTNSEEMLISLKNFLEGYILYSEQFRNVNVQFDFDPIYGY